ncbi:hypothetical protein ACVGVM_24485 [Pseudonocardia bannensis]|uniref:Secreted protein n=1 Tax=Pseudonocardia bannensis TaxID=630973 RepID=A0A848DLM9_9PSEU|nr:hypothetical protein [Pseudonocardia bannensis]NMH93680.1 hypothetical protein [Pseudonocardia bannensis]
MLKKAGIVVAAAAAGLLAVSPLAFAGDKGDKGDWGHDHGTEQVNSQKELHQGLVNVSDNNVNVPVQVCNNDVPVAVSGVGAAVAAQKVATPLSGALGLFGNAESETESVIKDKRNCDQDAAAGDVLQQSNND